MFHIYSRWAYGLGAVLSVASCARYTPQPVDPAAVAQLLTTRDAATVQAVLDPQQGFNLADGITVAEAEATALFFNPALRVTRLQVGLPQAVAEFAGRWEDPELGVDGAYILDDVAEPWVLGASLAITIPLSGRPGLQKQLARAQIDEAEAVVLGAEWALRMAVRQAYVELAQQRALQQLSINMVARWQQLLAIMPQLQQAGLMTSADQRSLHLRLVRGQQAVVAQAAALRQAERTIIALLGLHPDRSWQVQVATSDLQKRLQPRSEQALWQHPDVAAMVAAYQVAERQVQLEIRRQYPDLTIGFGPGSEEGDSRLNFGLGLLPVPVWNRNKSGIAAARAERVIAAEHISQAIHHLIIRRDAAVQELEQHSQELAFVEKSWLPLAEEHIADVQRIVGLGEIDIFLMVDAWEQWYQAAIAQVEAEHAVLAAHGSLQALAGPQLEKSDDQ